MESEIEIRLLELRLKYGQDIQEVIREMLGDESAENIKNELNKLADRKSKLEGHHTGPNNLSPTDLSAGSSSSDEPNGPEPKEYEFDISDEGLSAFE